MKKLVVFCVMLLSLSACANAAPERETDAPTLADTETVPAESVTETVPAADETDGAGGETLLVDLPFQRIGHLEFSSVAETLNVDGACYGKEYIFDGNRNTEPPAALAELGLTYEELDLAEKIGEGYIATGSIAYNDFRVKAPEYGSEKCAVYRVNDEFILFHDMNVYKNSSKILDLRILR